MSRLSKLVPSGRAERTLAAASFVHSVGFGSFAASSALFFTRSAGLSVGEVGIGTAIAGLAAIVAAVVAGRLADRVGARELLVVLSVAQTVLFGAYSVVHTFPAFLLVICTFTMADHGARTARNTVIAGLTAGSDRVRLKSFLRSVSNLGISLGTLIGAVPLHLDTRAAYLAVIFFNTAAAAVTTWLATQLPRTPKVVALAAPRGWVALGDRPYMKVAVLCGLLATYNSLLNIALPLWVVGHTDVPAVAIAGLFVANTVLGIGLQLGASRRADTLQAAQRTAMVAARLVAPACALFAVAAALPARSAFAVLVAGVVVLTVAEVWASVATWSLSFELADSRVPGQYQGAFSLGMAVETVAGPVLATALVLGLGAAGWLVAGGLFVLLGGAIAGATQRAMATRPVAAPGLDPDATVRLATADMTVRLAYADPAMRLAYPEAATDLLSVPADPWSGAAASRGRSG